jgi:hypothetical protein
MATKMVKLLLRHGAKAHIPTRSKHGSRTPLDVARAAGAAHVVRAIEHHGGTRSGSERSPSPQPAKRRRTRAPSEDF